MNKSYLKLVTDKQNIIIAILTIALGFVSFTTFLNYESIQAIKAEDKTIIVPLNQSSPFWITENELDNKYMVSMARYIADLYQSITAANVLDRYNKILALTSSKKYQNIKLTLYKKANKIKRYKRNAWSLKIDKVQINTKTKKLFVKGQLTRFSKSGIKQPKKN